MRAVSFAIRAGPFNRDGIGQPRQRLPVVQAVGVYDMIYEGPVRPWLVSQRSTLGQPRIRALLAIRILSHLLKTPIQMTVPTGQRTVDV
jgi:hypothetical protein